MNSRKPSNTRIWIIVAVVVTLLVAMGCVVVWAIIEFAAPASTGTSTAVEPIGIDPQEATIRIAYSPEKADLFEELAKGFNDQKLRTEDRQPMRVAVEASSVEQMLQFAVDGHLEAISPDSSLWLSELNRMWSEARDTEAELVGESHRYAISPVVLAMWEPVANDLGWPDEPVGWVDVQRLAQQDDSFRWSHPSTSSASGLLATLAEFYAGAGKTRGLTVEDAQNQDTLDYVAAVERTVRYYGEGELAVIEQARKEGPDYLDAFVVQEQLVVQFNRENRREPRLVAVYPAEGTLWEDHPLVLLEQPTLTANQRRTFQSFREYLQSEAVQTTVLSYGYRPSDLSIMLDGPDSPLTVANGVDPYEPQTTLQMPGPSVVDVVRHVWWYTKRHTNVYLVVDTSGSMSGEKLEQAQEALRVFLGQIQGDLEGVGMVEFSTQVTNIIQLDQLGNNRADLEKAVEALYADGDTALLDAVRAALVRLDRLNQPERINAIVAMTDGRENASSVSLRELVREVEIVNQSGSPVVIFCIAYGEDAEYDLLQALADASGGQVRTGDLETIQELYKILSTYF